MLRYLVIILLISSSVNANNYHVFGIGFFDFELDEDLQGNNLATDYKYELRLDDVIYKIGPEQDNFFYLKPLKLIKSVIPDNNENTYFN